MYQWQDMQARLAQVDEMKREAADYRRLKQAAAAQHAGETPASLMTRLGQWVKGLTWLL
jgi:hypothetical protein